MADGKGKTRDLDFGLWQNISDGLALVKSTVAFQEDRASGCMCAWHVAG